MRKEAFEPQVNAWALEQTELRSLKSYMTSAAHRVLANDLAEAETLLELALVSLKRARAAHTRWAGE